MGKLSYRKVAKARGKKYYSTGRPCKNGHVALRRTDNGQCLKCFNELSERLNLRTTNFDRALKLYGLAEADYRAMLHEQNNSCGICKIQFDDSLRSTVDHDHKTGKVRGLLCDRCNKGLGHFLDNVMLLRGAVEYLKKHK